MQQEDKKYITTFETAVNWLDFSMVLVPTRALFETDENFCYEDVLNMRETEEGEIDLEIFQTFITSLDSQQANYLADHFDLNFAWHDKLECWVLLVYHFGTPWCGVKTYTDIEEAQRTI